MQYGCCPIALTQGSKRVLIPPFKFLGISTQIKSKERLHLQALMISPISKQCGLYGDRVDHPRRPKILQNVHLALSTEAKKLPETKLSLSSLIPSPMNQILSPSPSRIIQYRPDWLDKIKHSIQKLRTRQVGAIKLYGPFWQNWFFFFKHKMADYSAHFHEKFSLKKLLLIFVKLKKQNVVRIHESSSFTKKVVCTTYIVLGFFGSPAKWRECTYDYIALNLWIVRD